VTYVVSGAKIQISFQKARKAECVWRQVQVCKQVQLLAVPVS